MSQPETGLTRETAASAPETAPVRIAASGLRPRRAIIAALLFTIVVLVGGMVLLRAYVVNPIPEFTEAELDKAEQRWDRAGPAGYDMDLEIRGARPGKVHVEVRNHKVTSVTINGRRPSEWTRDTWSVPGQFETLEQELQLAEDPVHEMQAAAGTRLRLRADFDPKYGYPRQYHRHVSGGGPEVYWRVTGFTPK